MPPLSMMRAGVDPAVGRLKPGFWSAFFWLTGLLHLGLMFKPPEALAEGEGVAL